MTLRMDDELIKRAKAAAKQRGKSVSRMVSEFFESLGKEAPYDEALPPITSSLLGIVKGTKLEIADHKKHLQEKHG